MIPQQTKVVQDSAVYGEYDVTFSISKEESNELKKALAVIDKYEKAALEELKETAGGDLRTFRYFLRSNSVIIKVSEGAIG
jgi:hypothetical protein